MLTGERTRKRCRSALSLHAGARHAVVTLPVGLPNIDFSADFAGSVAIDEDGCRRARPRVRTRGDAADAAGVGKRVSGDAAAPASFSWLLPAAGWHGDCLVAEHAVTPSGRTP